MYYFCTYFDHHYLDKGVALYHSLVTHCSPFRLWILCMDEVTYRILTDMNLPQVQLISLSELERNNFLLLQAKQNRSLIEYYFTCTPSLPLYIVNNVPYVDIITYLDADLYFFSSIEPVYQELGNASVLLIEHKFPRILKHLEIYGIYNVGMLLFRRDTNGLACLNWWQSQSLEWCYDRVENGRFAEQKYLDYWPHKFSGVVVLQHKGAGLAPWNLANYVYSWKDKELLIDDHPIIVYHFHGIKRINRWIYDTNVMTYKTRLPKIVKEGLYIPYLKELNHVNQNLNRYLVRKFYDKGLIRGSNTLKTKIYDILKIAMFPIIYFQKFVNNDLILN